MLYADIHRKLAVDARDVERSEDVLTSTVFGTLFLAGAWDVLARWLARATPHGSYGALATFQHDLDYWFWPRLALAEPDVVVRMGDVLVIVEAKYHAHKHGKDGPAADDLTAMETRDQLARQWESCLPSAITSGYPAALGEAIVQCPRRALVYLVKRGRKPRARRELAEAAVAAGMSPNAPLYLLTWEDLDDVLEHECSLRWARDLRSYLSNRLLTTYRGLADALTDRPTAILQRWRRQPVGPLPMHRAFARCSLPVLAQLARHRDPAPCAPWARAIPAGQLDDLASLARRPSRFPTMEQPDG